MKQNNLWYFSFVKICGGKEVFGAIFGDVIGSNYEVHCTKDYNFSFNNESTFTDDSVLIAAVCKTILNNPCAASRFAIS